MNRSQPVTAKRSIAAGSRHRRHRRRRLLGLVPFLSLLVAVSTTSLAPAQADPLAPPTSAELELIGKSTLRGEGLNTQVAVVGETAIVGSGINPGGGVHTGFYNPYPCPQSHVELVDLRNPSKPTVVGRIVVRPGVSALDVDAIEVDTPTFDGDLAAVAFAACGGAGGSIHNRGVAFYNINNPARPRFLGRYLADMEDFDPDVECGHPTEEGDRPRTGPESCASSQHSVDLVQRPDGTVLSVSTEPFATASGFPSGDLRIVDATNPRSPVQVSSLPPPPTPPPPGFSTNGCRPFSAGHDAELTSDGAHAYLAYLDDGVFNVDVSDPAAPSIAGQVDPYPAGPPDNRTTEGNGAYVTPAGPTEELALLADEDWIAPTTNLRVDSPAQGPPIVRPGLPDLPGLTSGDKFGCEAMFTLFDPEDTAQIYRQAGSQVPAGGGAADLAYIGRGCPVNTAFGTAVPDPYLNDAGGNPVDVSGKIAVIDRFRTPFQMSQLPNAGSGCQAAEKVKRAQDNGAIAVVFDAQFGDAAFSFDGVAAGLTIPVMSLDRPAAIQVRLTLCPSVNPMGSGNCTAGLPVTGALVDSAGDWGGLRVIDLAASTQVGQYETLRSQVFPPPDLGVYSVHHAVADGNRAHVAWNSDGLRILDLTNPAAPVEVGHFVPPDTPDPNGVIPAKAYVTGVAVAGCNVVITDINSGLYVVRDPGLCP